MFTTGPQKELEHVLIADLSLDSFGTLWLGTLAAGLVKYDEKTLLKSYIYSNDSKTSLTPGWANNIYEASNGRIWITTGGSEKYSGINILNLETGDLRKITYPQLKNRINGVSALWENSPGEYYPAAYNGIYKFSENTLQLIAANPAGLPGNSVINSHFKDSKGNEWLCTRVESIKKKKALTPTNTMISAC